MGKIKDLYVEFNGVVTLNLDKIVKDNNIVDLSTHANMLNILYMSIFDEIKKRDE